MTAGTSPGSPRQRGSRPAITTATAMRPAGALARLLVLLPLCAWPALSRSAPPAAPAEIAPIQAPFEMPQLQRPVFPDRTVRIADHGALADGTTKNTTAFRKAIAACHAAGGGTVLVPPGKWLTGAIHLRSNVNLHLQEGAEIHFSDDPDDYLPAVFVRYAGIECHNYSPLIYARDCTNIALTGGGTIHGHGKAWWEWSKRGTNSERQTYQRLDAMVAAKRPVAERIMPTGQQHGFRPTMVEFIGCKNVLIEGPTLLDSPFWNIHPTYCENLIVRQVKVVNRSPNGDGINPDSCRNVLIEDCLTDTGDDCITLKSGMNEDGRRVARPCENIVVRNCRTKAGHGGVTIGSDMSGGVRNVWAHDCDFSRTDIGIRLKTMRGRGGVVENLHFRDITMNGVGYGIHITTFYHQTPAEPVSERTPTFRNIHIRNITAHGVKKGTISVTGLPERPVTGLTLENVTMDGAGGGQFTDVENLRLINVRITPASGKPLTFKNCQNVVQE